MFTKSTFRKISIIEDPIINSTILGVSRVKPWSLCRVSGLGLERIQLKTPSGVLYKMEEFKSVS